MKAKKTKGNKSKTNEPQIITINNNGVINGKVMCTVIMHEDDSKLVLRHFQINMENQ